MNEDKDIDITQELFNCYPALYCDYLRGNMIDVRQGWYNIVRDLSHDLALLPGVHILQIKEKFGELRCYVDIDEYWTDKYLVEVQDTLEWYEWKASLTCEDCGQVGGKLRTDLSWWTTLCNDCYEAVLKYREALMEKRTINVMEYKSHDGETD